MASQLEFDNYVAPAGVRSIVESLGGDDLAECVKGTAVTDMTVGTTEEGMPEWCVSATRSSDGAVVTERFDAVVLTAPVPGVLDIGGDLGVLWQPWGPKGTIVFPR